MKILLIANHLNVGGIASYLLILGSSLKHRGHQVYLACGGGELEEKFLAAGIKLLRVPLRTKQEISPQILVSFLKLKRMAGKLEIDVIHSHSRTTQVLGCLLARALNKPHVFTCHGFFKPRLLRRLCGCWGKMVIAISQQVQEHLINDFKLAASRIQVVHNGIDLERFKDCSGREQARAEFGGRQIILIGIIARLSDVKGHIHLIRALPAVAKQFPSLKLLIVGQGKTQRFLEEAVVSLGLAGQATFIPQVRDTRDLLCALDIFVMPSLQEGLGLALMEAMAQGLAVVGSRVGGIKTLIQHNLNGLLVEPADTQGLAAALISLAADPDLRRRLGQEARKFIAANFSAQKMAEQTEFVYRQVLQEKTKGG